VIELPPSKIRPPADPPRRCESAPSPNWILYEWVIFSPAPKKQTNTRGPGVWCGGCRFFIEALESIRPDLRALEGALRLFLRESVPQRAKCTRRACNLKVGRDR